MTSNLHSICVRALAEASEPIRATEFFSQNMNDFYTVQDDDRMNFYSYRMRDIIPTNFRAQVIKPREDYFSIFVSSPPFSRDAYPFNEAFFPPASNDSLRNLEFTYMLDHFVWGPYSSQSLRDKLYGNEVIDDVFISVHTMNRNDIELHGTWEGNDLREGLADRVRNDLLSSEDFQSIPRVLLASDIFPVQDEDFLREATAVFFSEGGEFPRMIALSRRYHLVGEQLSRCLVSAGRRIAMQLKSQDELLDTTLYLYRDYILDHSYSRVERINGRNSEELLRKYISKIFFHKSYESNYRVINDGPCLDAVIPDSDKVIRVCLR